MKPKSSSNILSAFSAFKQNKVSKKKTLKGPKKHSLTPAQVKVLKESEVMTKDTQLLNGSYSGSFNSPTSTKKSRSLNKSDVPHSLNTSSTKKKKKNELDSASKVKKSNSVQCGNPEAEKCFLWLIHPTPLKEFFGEIFEKKPILIQRSKMYYKGIFSCASFDKMMRLHQLEYNTNIDIVSYVNGERQTHNPDGRAYASVIWDYFENGCSIRLLNPQTYNSSVWKLCSLLTEYFGSFCGANMYLTPRGSQGFAPHYDDIEAFVLQIEGQKIWKVYPPRCPSEELPRLPSPNFKQEELGQPMLEVTLNPGDLLYMPRGYIHQACTPESTHSLHLTVSTYQKHTWGDFLTKLIPKAIEDAMEGDVKYRESLPFDYLDCMGSVNSSKDMEGREAFLRKLIQLTKGLVKYLSPDTTTDNIAKDFIHASLPPSLTQEEKLRSIHGNGECWLDGRVQNRVELSPDTEIRFIRKRAVRLVREEEGMNLYHSFENSRVYKEKEPQYVKIEWELIPAVEQLLETCPEYTKVEDLALSTLEEKMDIASLLYDKGLVETKIPLTESDDDVC